MYNKLHSFLISLIKHLKNKSKNVDSKIYQQRIITCFKCDKRTKNWKCSECGCLLELKAKWASEECPLGKWEKIPLETIQDFSVKSPCGCSS